MMTRERSVSCLRFFAGAFFVIYMTLDLTGCSPSRDATTGGWTQAELQMPAGIAAGHLPAPESRGAQLTARYCSQCHGTPSPASQSASDWVPIMRRMMLRMERSASMGQVMGRGMMGRNRPMGMMGAAVPTRSEERDILAYLQNHALKSTSQGKLPESASSAATLYERTCSRCHALPDPSAHTPGQCPSVVRRMREYMRSAGVPAIWDEQAQTLIGYLERASRG